MFVRVASLALALSVSLAAHADSLTFTLNNASQTALASGGSTLTFSGTLSAPSSNSGNEYLNGDTYNSPSPLVLDDTPFYLYTPLYLAPGQSFTGALFTVTAPAGTMANLYTGSFSVLGGSSGFAFNTLGTQNFAVSVTSPAAVTPEPSSLLLLGTGMVGAVAALRRRVVRFSR